MSLPLEGLFRHLVRSGFPLAVRDYEDALTALRLGHGTLTRERLHWLCATLWAHSDEERIRLARLFDALPRPTADAIRMLTGAGGKPQAVDDTAPAGEPLPQATTEPPRDGTAAESPMLQFAAPQESGGVGLPQARVPAALLQPHILTPRPAVSLRALIVTWRRFRLAQRSGPKVELDIDATVAEKCRSGTLVEPVLLPARCNQARLLVLFDASPSMAPWQHMGKAVADSLGRARLGHAAFYYFNNDPGEGLFDSERLMRPHSMQEVVRRHADCALLVVSDAGAARGRMDRERVRATQSFADAARRVAWWPIAWVNSMPRERWSTSSAARIAALPGITMFELTEDGMVQAIDHLRGKGRH